MDRLLSVSPSPSRRSKGSWFSSLLGKDENKETKRSPSSSPKAPRAVVATSPKSPRGGSSPKREKEKVQIKINVKDDSLLKVNNGQNGSLSIGNPRSLGRSFQKKEQRGRLSEIFGGNGYINVGSSREKSSQGHATPTLPSPSNGIQASLEFKFICLFQYLLIQCFFFQRKQETSKDRRICQTQCRKDLF
jgi:hypothetical protein